MKFNQQYISQHFLAIVVALQVVMYLTLFLDLTVARIVIGIGYLTFIPGLIIVKLLKLDKLSIVESILYSVGFSVAFLMIAGLVINQFGFLLGLTFPLATLPLSLFINTLIIVSAAVAHLRQGTPKGVFPQKVGFTRSMLLLTLIPLLAVAGAYFVDATGNNLLLLITISAIAALFSVSLYFERSSKVYVFAILMIALALLLQGSLISNYIMPNGGDIPVNSSFQNTRLNMHWNPIFTFPLMKRLADITRC